MTARTPEEVAERAIGYSRAWDDAGLCNIGVLSSEIVTALRSAGLLAEPEVAPEQWAALMDAERARQIEHGYDEEHDRQHGLKHLLGWAIDYARRGKVLAAATLVRQALLLAEPDCQCYGADGVSDQKCPACEGHGDEGSNYLNSGKCQACGGSGVAREALASRLMAIAAHTPFSDPDFLHRIVDGILAAGWRPPALVEAPSEDEPMWRHSTGFTSKSPFCNDLTCTEDCSATRVVASRPPALVGGDAVERAAVACFTSNNDRGWTVEDWNTWLGDDIRAIWRRYARAALQAAALPAPVDESTDLPAASAGPDLHQVIDELKAQLAGETVTTAGELDALPVGSVVLDDDGDVWQRRESGIWCSYETATFGSARVARHFGPLRVLFRPSTEGVGNADPS